MARATSVTSARAMALGAPPLAWFCAAHWPDFTPPLTLMTDNGSRYRARTCAAACKALNIKHIRTKPTTPKTNGKAESVRR